MIFVCENCGCVDSTLFINPNNNNMFPNMTLEEMKGEAKRSINISNLEGYQKSLASDEWNRPLDPINGTIPDVIENFEPLEYKYADMVLMLCSECNTGVWGSQFKKLKATSEMVSLAEQDLFKTIDKEDNFELAIEFIENKEIKNV